MNWAFGTIWTVAVVGLTTLGAVRLGTIIVWALHRRRRWSPHKGPIECAYREGYEAGRRAGMIYGAASRGRVDSDYLFSKASADSWLYDWGWP